MALCRNTVVVGQEFKSFKCTPLRCVSLEDGFVDLRFSG